MATEIVTVELGKVLFCGFIGLLVWFIITVLFMLILAHKSRKKAQILTVFIVSSILLLVALLVAYFKVEMVAGWLA